MSEYYPKIVPELYVSDLGKSLKFYTEIAGFSVKYDRPAEGFAYLDNNGAHLMLEEIDNPSTDSPWITGELKAPLGRGINFQIEVDDVDTIYQKAAEQNILITLPIEEKWYQTGDTEGGNRQFMLQDPDGYLLRFFTEIQK
ncbi:MAG: VOC family protein [Alphaproteobacteria bacterium]|nr:VOC family protein [Alphaproteobacteria bacterium]